MLELENVCRSDVRWDGNNRRRSLLSAWICAVHGRWHNPQPDHTYILHISFSRPIFLSPRFPPPISVSSILQTTPLLCFRVLTVFDYLILATSSRVLTRHITLVFSRCAARLSSAIYPLCPSSSPLLLYGSACAGQAILTNLLCPRTWRHYSRQDIFLRHRFLFSLSLFLQHDDYVSFTEKTRIQ